MSGFGVQLLDLMLHFGCAEKKKIMLNILVLYVNVSLFWLLDWIGQRETE